MPNRVVNMVRNKHPAVHNISEPNLSKAKKGEIYHGNFRSYCSHLLKGSMITGIPEIASAKTTVRRGIKGIVFLICIAGFTYQTYSFMEMFLRYPTILDIKNEIPDTIEAPAVTVCNRNRLRRKVYCTELPENCNWSLKNKEVFCDIYPIFCPKTGSNIMLAVPDFPKIVNGNASFALLNAAGLRQEDLIRNRNCVIVAGTEKFNCSKIVLVQAAHDGFPHNCYSVKSLWGNPQETPLKIPVTSEHNMFVDIHPEEYLKYRDLFQVYIHVHDPHSIVNAFEEGLTLKAGKKYRLYVRMEHRQNLPPPYDTNCTDYKEMWRGNGGYGPLTKRDCIEQCKIDAMVKEHGCVAKSTWYPNNYTICGKKSMVPSKETNERCTKNCNDPCDEKLYITTAELLDDMTQLSCPENDEVCKFRVVAVSIRFSRMMITKFKYDPKFQDVEMFSYIGGYIGMWLGISLVALFDFLETLADIIAYPVMKWRKTKKVAKHTENTHQNFMFNTYNY